MAERITVPHAQGKHRYTSVVEGVALANDFAASRLTMSEFARQRGVSFNMVRYWSSRARQLATASAPALVQVGEISPSGAVASANVPSAPPTVAPDAAVSRLPAVALGSAVPAIEVRLPNGVRIGIGAGFSPHVLAQVISCLGAQPC